MHLSLLLSTTSVKTETSSSQNEMIGKEEIFMSVVRITYSYSFIKQYLIDLKRN